MKRIMVMALFLLFLMMGVPRIFGNEAGQMVFYVLVGAFGVGMVLYMRWFQKFARQVNALMPLLSDDPLRYITEMEKLLEGRRPANIRAMLEMNVAAAHMEMGDYSTAKSKLLGINGLRLKGANAAVYFLNLTYVYIHTNEKEKALDFIRRYRKQFLTLPMGGNLPHLNAFIAIYEAMQNGQWETAREKMVEAKTEWPDKVTGVDFDFLLKEINRHFGGDVLKDAAQAAPPAVLGEESEEEAVAEIETIEEDKTNF